MAIAERCGGLDAILKNLGFVDHSDEIDVDDIGLDWRGVLGLGDRAFGVLHREEWHGVTGWSVIEIDGADSGMVVQVRGDGTWGGC